jgi:hypothetical protein
MSFRREVREYPDMKRDSKVQIGDTSARRDFDLSCRFKLTFCQSYFHGITDHHR